MPKHSTATILKRWREMDKLLLGVGLHIPAFAKLWAVSEKTVRRDLKAFGELGRPAVPQVMEAQRATRAERRQSGEKVYAGVKLVWRYSPEVRPLFRHGPPKG